MNKNLTLGLCVLLLAAACGPSPAVISTAVAASQEFAIGTAIAATEQADAAATAAFAELHGDCPVDQVLAADDELQGIMGRWQDAFDVANATGRGTLPGPVGVLQSVRSDARDFVIPTCLETAKESLVEGMDAVIDGFLDFMAQKADPVVNASFAKAADAFSAYQDELARIVLCAPECD